MDHALLRIVEHTSIRPVDYLVGVLAEAFEIVQPRLVDALVTRGVLARLKFNRLCLRSARYQVTAEGKPLGDVKPRIAWVLLRDELPDLRDIMIVSLADPAVCGATSWTSPVEAFLRKKSNRSPVWI